MLVFRVALGLFSVLLLTAPASAQFTTSDLAGSWILHGLRVGQGPSAPPTWTTGNVTFEESGAVSAGAVFDAGGQPVDLTPGALTVSPDGAIVGTLGNTSIQARFLPGPGTARKTQVVGVATSDVSTPDETAAFFFLVRVTPTTFTQSDVTGTWRLKSLHVPEPDATGSEYLLGRLEISSEGEIITGSSLESSNGSISTVVLGNVSVGGDVGFVTGTVATDPFDNSILVGTLTPDKGLMVSIVSRVVGTEVRLGLAVLQREPTLPYDTADLAGQWELFSVQSTEDPGDSGFWLTGTITVDDDGNVTDGALRTSSGLELVEVTGLLQIDGVGLVNGPILTELGAIVTQATMLPARDQIVGVDRFSGDLPSHLGLFTLVKAAPAEPASTVQFRSGNVSVTEGTAATVVVDRSGVTSTAVTVTYTATPLTAVPGQDYTPVSGTLSFPAGATVRSFSVPTTADNRLNGERSVRLSLGAPTGGAMLGRDTSLLTIRDNDQAGVVRLGSAVYTVAESASALVVTLVRAGTSLAGNVSVSLVTGNASALSGLDYTAVDTTVTFAANQTTRTVGVPILHDTLAEGNEAFTVSLRDPTGGATLGTPVTATATITDNDVAGSLTFDRAAYSVTENGGSVTLKVLRSGVASGVTVRFVTGDGTASSEGGDYERREGLLTFAAGNTSATITIPINQDLQTEGNETFTVTLVNPQGGAALAAPFVATVTIVDDESAFQFSADAYSVKEGAGHAVITIQRLGARVTPATVTFTASPGSAAAALDFTPVSTVVSFPANTASKTVSVPVRNNTLVQGNRTVLLELGGPTGGAQIGTRGSAVLTLVEDDQPGVVKLGAAAYSVAEKGRSLLVRILRTGVNLAGNVSVSYATGNGSATTDLDYTAVADTVTFNAGETAKIVSIPIHDDTLVEGNERFTFSIVGATTGALVGTPATAIATIVDDDRGGLVKLSAAAHAFTEGAGNVSVTVVRSGGTASEVLVDYAFQDVTATAGSDYEAVSGTLSFAANQTSATILVPIVQDLLDEGNEAFRITLGNVSGGASLATPATTTVTIRDDESAIQFMRPDFAGREGAPAVVTLVRSGARATPASVTFTASPGTAQPGLDFSPVSSLVSFPANVTTRTVPVPLLNNSLVQGNRTVLLALGAPTGGAQLGTNATAVLTALDDDQGGVIRLARSAYVVTESAAALVVEILRAGTRLAGNVSVDYATMDGTAGANVSYLARLGTLAFNAGETRKTVSIPIVNDTVVRGPLSFRFGLSRPTGGASLGTPASATIAIADNDLGGIVRFSAGTYQTVDGNGNFSVTVIRSGGAASEAAVDYAIVHGSTNAEDLAATSGTLTFAAGQATAVIPIPIFGNSTPEGNETFSVVLSNPRGGAALGAPTKAVVTLVDDEMVIQFSGNFTGNRPEVVRTGPLGASATVRFTTTSGTAGLGEDFRLAESGTLVFPAGKATALVPLTIVADNLAEGPETFTVTLSNPSEPARLGPDAARTFSIFDDDFGGTVQFDAAAYAGLEGEMVTLTIRRQGGLGTVLPVSWSVMGGNASAGTDFSNTSGVVTFGTTEVRKTVVVALAADQLVEGLESAFIALDVAPGAAELGPHAVTELQIQDATVTSTFQLDSPTYSVLEGDMAAVVITRSGDLSTSASVEFTTSPGTALAGDDYSLTGGSAEFGANASSVTVFVQTSADQILEGPETFSLTLRNPSTGAAFGTPVTTVVTITEAPAAQAYTFSLVAEAASPISSFTSVPAINNGGAVVFGAVLDDGNQSVMAGLAGALSTLASTGDGTFTGFGRPAIADSGEVAFRAFLGATGTAVYRAAGDGTLLLPVAEPDASYGGFGDPSLSPGGRISFRASLNTGEEAVLGGVLGGGLFTIADDAAGRFAGFGPRTAVGDLDNQVTFEAAESAGASGLYLSNVDGDDGVVTQIVDGGAFDGFAQFLSINDQGRVAFLGFPISGGSGIFLGGNGSAVTTLVSTDGPFIGFGDDGADGTPSINDQGRVAFHAFLQDESTGIFTGPDPVVDKVIRMGDPLFGSTVSQLVLGGMNNAGQIVFRAFLADERDVIVVASPVGGALAQPDIPISD